NPTVWEHKRLYHSCPSNLVLCTISADSFYGTPSTRLLLQGSFYRLFYGLEFDELFPLYPSYFICSISCAILGAASIRTFDVIQVACVRSILIDAGREIFDVFLRFAQAAEFAVQDQPLLSPGFVAGDDAKIGLLEHCVVIEKFQEVLQSFRLARQCRKYLD